MGFVLAGRKVVPNSPFRRKDRWRSI
jgi:hypothetical protein